MTYLLIHIWLGPENQRPQGVKTGGKRPALLSISKEDQIWAQEDESTGLFHFLPVLGPWSAPGSEREGWGFGAQGGDTGTLSHPSFKCGSTSSTAHFLDGDFKTQKGYGFANSIQLCPHVKVKVRSQGF